MFLLEALRSGEFYCMVVCMCEGKGTYLGTLLRSTMIVFVEIVFVFSSNDDNRRSIGGHSLLDFKK